MKLVLDSLSLRSPRILHIAPERAIAPYLVEIASEYIPVDIDVERYRHIPGIRYIDLCDAPSFSSFGKFDLIIHSHVIEHLPCNWSAVLLALHGMLRDGGYQLCSFPIYGDGYRENLCDLTDGERVKEFGQFDHVRRFSARDLHVTLGMLFNLPRDVDLVSSFGQDVLTAANIPEEAWKGYSGHSIIPLAKSDALFSPMAGRGNIP